MNWLILDADNEFNRTIQNKSEDNIEDIGDYDSRTQLIVEQKQLCR